MNEETLLQLMKALDNGTNMFGKLSPDVRARLYAVVDNPTSETWGDANGIILRDGGMRTLWQALLRHTDYNVTTGPSVRMGEETVWPQHMIPTTEQLCAALLAELG